ncbi:LAME_0F19152g1_1 [Lachancea meyersii CBS 8951]|uniref:LAME_0F19152g1_1 n=1 Tax=Lachancea meyersii CBS 8951 TaxID=1266667 RepID=A0A1G4K176_9SACH|nr:LAME_0F19152g1_1 [Lachancea meyersii CBS 8951]
MEEEEIQLKIQLKEAKAKELARRKKKRQHTEEGNTIRRSPPNCAIYISNLPLHDLKDDDLIDEFTKFGIIRKDPISNRPKCKIYVNEDGKLKGDALIVYLKPESVKMAVEFMNGTHLKGKTLKVEEATFKSDPQKVEASDEGVEEFRKLKLRKLREQEHDLNDWKDDEESESRNSESGTPNTDPSSDEEEDKSARTVLLTNALDLYKKLSSVEVSEIAADLRDGCEAVGEVLNFELDEVLGQVKVEYSTQELAQKCCKMMNGRYFDGRKLMAYTLDAEEDEGDTEITSL